MVRGASSPGPCTHYTRLQAPACSPMDMCPMAHQGGREAGCCVHGQHPPRAYPVPGTVLLTRAWGTLLNAPGTLGAGCYICLCLSSEPGQPRVSPLGTVPPRPQKPFLVSQKDHHSASEAQGPLGMFVSSQHPCSQKRESLLVEFRRSPALSHVTLCDVVLLFWKEGSRSEERAYARRMLCRC